MLLKFPSVTFAMEPKNVFPIAFKMKSMSLKFSILSIVKLKIKPPPLKRDLLLERCLKAIPKQIKKSKIPNETIKRGRKKMIGFERSVN